MRKHIIRITGLGLAALAIAGILALPFSSTFKSAVSASGFAPAPGIEQTVFALTTGNKNKLVSFDSATPGIINSSVSITGLQIGETVLGIDFRPRTGQLYAMGSFSNIYTIDTATGAATLVGSFAGTIPLNGTEFGVDFNPTVDRIRVVSDADQNLRLNPANAAVSDFDPNTPGIQPDLNLNYADGSDPNVVGSAYTNNFDGATTTMLFGIDSNTDSLVLQNPPNNGGLTRIGPLGVNTSNLSGFDISPSTGVAYASLTSVGSSASQLYTINLTTGAASLIGGIGNGLSIRDIAVKLRPQTVFAVTPSNKLLAFNSGTPTSINRTARITGLQIGETVLGIDFRPRTGQLYAMGSFSNIYTIDTATGAATLVGSFAGTIPLNGTEFGVDFNPTVDRIRVVSDADQNLRLNPANAAVSDFDPNTPGIQPDLNLNYADGSDPNVVGSAYTNNFDGATTTMLFGIDSNTDSLVLQNPPNNGTLTRVGPLGVNTSNLSGFDITAGNEAAFASLTPAGSVASNLYTINLTTGAASLIGQIGGGEVVRDIALVGFDFSIKDVASGSALRFNSINGDYEFVDCAKGFTLTGTGAVTIQGCKVRLSDNGPNRKRADRNVSALANVCSRAGRATVQFFSMTNNNSLSDNAITDNTRFCQ